MIPYFIELSIIHLALSLVYITLLSREKQYHFRRWYLLLSIPISTLVPLIDMKSLSAALQFNQPEPGFTVTYWLNPLSVGTQSAVDQFMLIKWLYGVIAGVFVLVLIYGIIQIFHYFQASEQLKINGYLIRKVNGISGSFTFFGWIFIEKKQWENESGLAPIIEHEIAHSKLLHSLDLLFSSLFRAFCWFLPSAWWLMKELKKVHEYEADQFALRKFSLSEYSNLLIANTLRSNGLVLANSFNDGPISQRINEMKKQFRKMKQWKMAIVSIFCVLVIITFSCNEELDAEIQKIGDQATGVMEVPKKYQPEFQELENIHGKGKIKYMEILITDEGSEMNEQLKKLNPDLFLSVHVEKEDGIIGIFMKEGKALDYAGEKTVKVRESGAVFTIVEDQPEFPGGISAFYKYVAENMKYPSQARKMGIEGRVFVQFIVDTDGTITEVQPVKGIGGGCDLEATRVIMEAPKFNPGRQNGQAVKVRMVMPIIFKLDHEAKPDVNTIRG